MEKQTNKKNTHKFKLIKKNPNSKIRAYINRANNKPFSWILMCPSYFHSQSMSTFTKGSEVLPNYSRSAICIRHGGGGGLIGY